MGFKTAGEDTKLGGEEARIKVGPSLEAKTDEAMGGEDQYFN